MEEKKEPKKVKQICGNCYLFDSENKRCRVVIIHSDPKLIQQFGPKINIPVDPEDRCFFKNKFVASPVPFSQEVFEVDIKQVRFWVEDPNTGTPTEGSGEVKIEYPEGFFGQEQ